MMTNDEMDKLIETKIASSDTDLTALVMWRTLMVLKNMDASLARISSAVSKQGDSAVMGPRIRVQS